MPDEREIPIGDVHAPMRERAPDRDQPMDLQWPLRCEERASPDSRQEIDVVQLGGRPARVMADERGRREAVALVEEGHEVVLLAGGREEGERLGLAGARETDPDECDRLTRVAAAADSRDRQRGPHPGEHRGIVARDRLLDLAGERREARGSAGGDVGGGEGGEVSLQHGCPFNRPRGQAHCDRPPAEGRTPASPSQPGFWWCQWWCENLREWCDSAVVG